MRQRGRQRAALIEDIRSGYIGCKTKDGISATQRRIDELQKG